MWRVVAASVAGTSHAVTSAPCEDYHAFRLAGTAAAPVAILGLADGAGSAPASLYGAKTAVDAAVDGLAAFVAARGMDALELAALQEAVVAARLRVFQVVDDFGGMASDYASTLLVVVATPERTLAAHIGDGAIVVEQADLEVLSYPQQGEYANATRFLTDDDALGALRAVETGAARCIAVLSDGLQALALDYASRSAFGPFFGPVFERVALPSAAPADLNAELAAWLGSDAVNARTDDDKSLVVAVRMP